MCVSQNHTFHSSVKSFFPPNPNVKVLSLVPVFVWGFLVTAAPWNQNAPRNRLFVFVCFKARSHMVQTGLTLAR